MKKNDTFLGKSLLKGAFLLLEGIGVCLIYYLVWRRGYPAHIFPAYYYKGKYVLVGVYGVLFAFFFHNLEAFSLDLRRGVDLALRRGIGLFLLNFITYFQLSLIANRPISPLPMSLIFCAQTLFALFLVALYKKACRSFFPPMELVLVYGNDGAVGIKVKMDSRKDRYHILQMVDVKEGYEAVCRKISGFEGVILNDLPCPIRNDLLKFCYGNGQKVYVVPKISDILIGAGERLNLFDTPIIALKGGGIPYPRALIKRLFDVLFSAVILLFLLPVFFVIALAIKMEDGGEVFYRQKRLTLGGKEFEILKFRSMIPDAEKYSGATLSAGESDPRITGVGRLLRKSRMDEIPQFINVLKGEMSLVGPRPERKCFAEEFERKMPEFAFRTKVRAGLTGFAQIYGKYNTDPYDKLRLDLMYMENHSLQLDLKLLLLTLKIIFTKESTDGTEERKKETETAKKILSQTGA